MADDDTRPRAAVSIGLGHHALEAKSCGLERNGALTHGVHSHVEVDAINPILGDAPQLWQATPTVGIAALRASPASPILGRTVHRRTEPGHATAPVDTVVPTLGPEISRMRVHKS